MLARSYTTNYKFKDKSGKCKLAKKKLFLRPQRKVKFHLKIYINERQIKKGKINVESFFPFDSYSREK